MVHLSFEMNTGIKAWERARAEGGKETAAPSRNTAVTPPSREAGLFPAVNLEQEAHRGHGGGSPLSKCDGHFNSQIAFSVLAHARIPPPPLVGKLTP